MKPRELLSNVLDTVKTIAGVPVRQMKVGCDLGIPPTGSEQTEQEDDPAGFPFTSTWYYFMNKKLKRISEGLDEINKILDGIPHFTRPSARTDTDDTGQDKMAP